MFYSVIVENKTYGLGSETNFDFKYIPDFHTRTAQGELGETGLKEPGIERQNLKVLVIASTVVCILSWYGIKMTLKVIESMLR